MSREDLVQQFCTPPHQDESDLDRRAFAKAQPLDIEFEDRILKGYSMGTGPEVLLVHGWSSRASHLALLARHLVNSGFHVLVFDGPAHGNSRNTRIEDTSSMFEFGRAISCVAKTMGNTYAVIGHSLGATAAAFTMAGTGHLSEYRIKAEKLVLISAPESIARIIESYSRDRDEMDMMAELTRGLENAFSFKVSDYSLSFALNQLNTRILIIHDEEDEEIPVSDAKRMQESNAESELKLTTGSGHQRILIDREMLRAVKAFLLA